MIPNQGEARQSARRNKDHKGLPPQSTLYRAYLAAPHLNIKSKTPRNAGSTDSVKCLGLVFPLTAVYSAALSIFLLSERLQRREDNGTQTPYRRGTACDYGIARH